MKDEEQKQTKKKGTMVTPYKNVKNGDIRNHVDKLEIFATKKRKEINDNSSVFSSLKIIYSHSLSIDSHSLIQTRQVQYVVYSYGEHFPMYVYNYDAGVWLGNSDKYSRTTSKHQSISRPSQGIHEWYSTIELRRIVDYGYIQIITKRLEGAYG